MVDQRSFADGASGGTAARARATINPATRRDSSLADRKCAPAQMREFAQSSAAAARPGKVRSILSNAPLALVSACWPIPNVVPPGRRRLPWLDSEMYRTGPDASENVCWRK